MPARRHICVCTGTILADEPGVHVPEVLNDLSTDRLLTMVWLDGEPLLEAVDTDLERRNEIAFNMFRAWYVPFYYYGVIHGDPHLGNYTVRPDASVNLLDFGCIRVFPPSLRRRRHPSLQRTTERRSRPGHTCLRDLGV